MAQQKIEVSPEPVPNLLRRLERELAPFADAASPSLEQRTVRRSFFLRIFERIAVAAALLMTIGSLWILSERWQRPTSIQQKNAETRQEIEQLKQALSVIEAERNKLREELEAERRADVVKPLSWHDDVIGLNYRSPWRSP